jgi:hypothetical protein
MEHTTPEPPSAAEPPSAPGSAPASPGAPGPPSAGSPGALPRPLDPALRRRVARRSLAFVGLISAIAAVAVALLAARGRVPEAVGAAAGAALGVAFGLSWLRGAIANFDAPFAELGGSTLGLAPFRALLVFAAAAGSTALGRDRIDPVTLALAFVLVRAALHFVEAAALGAFADAVRKPRPPR